MLASDDSTAGDLLAPNFLTVVCIRMFIVKAIVGETLLRVYARRTRFSATTDRSIEGIFA